MKKKYLLSSTKTLTDDYFSINILGGKGFHLFKLLEWGINVPSFFIITTSFFSDWQKNNNLIDEIVELLIFSIDEWKDTQYFAVRSSMSAEDGSDYSFAGIMDSFLYVKADLLKEKIVQCIESLFSIKSQKYQDQINLLEKQKAAVIIQKMIHTEKSGVAFSRSPKGNSSLTYIEAAFGLGEGVVSGLVEVDSYWMDRFHNLIKSEIRYKEKYIDRNKNNHTELFSVPEKNKNNPVLNLPELNKLNRQLIEIETHLGKPCDVEWCICKNNIYILQVRPITQKFPELKYYVDTNLAESYPGKTTPLTGSFVKKVYKKTFMESAYYLIKSKKLPAQLLPHYHTLICYFHGHLYYNLTSYYAVLFALPGGKLNIENWHRMIGGKPDNNMNFHHFYTPCIINSIKIMFNLIKLALFHKNIFSKFYSKNVLSFKNLFNILIRTEDSYNCVNLIINSFNSIKGFELTILNDVLIMISLKFLIIILNTAGYNEKYLPELIHTNEAIDSITALNKLQEIIILLRKNPTALKEYEKFINEWDQHDPSNFYNCLFAHFKNNGYRELYEKMKDYLNKFGDRAFEELKIESMTFNQSPQNFYTFLKWNLEKSTITEESHKKKKAIYKLDLNNFSTINRFLFHKILKFTRQVITTRENTRLTRGKYYGWFRSAFLKLIFLLKKEYKETFSHLDTKKFFFLTLEDLETYKEEQNKEIIVKAIKQREKRDVTIDQYPEFFCHPVDPENKIKPYFLESIKDNYSQIPPDNILRGVGVSTGKVSGRALILHSPEAALNEKNLHDKILVTRNTDPAWIFLMSECKGLISEKGSLLSHTAIIGRELAIPTIVGVKKATSILKTNMHIELNADSGIITII